MSRFWVAQASRLVAWPAGSVVMLLAAGFLAAGCVSSSSGTGPAATGPAVPLSAAEIAVLTNSGGTAPVGAELNNAVEILTGRCMRAKGLIYYPELEDVATATAQTLPELPLYRSLADRQSNGYGAYAVALQEAQSGHGTASPPNVPEQLYVASLSGAAYARYWAAWIGPESSSVNITLPGGTQTSIPSGGCRGAAVRSIYGSVANWIQSSNGAELITKHLTFLVQSNPRYVAVVGKWSQCMARSGYQYAAPFDAWNWFAGQYAKQGPTSSLHRLEIAVAVTDYRCAQAVSLVPVTTAVQSWAAAHLGITLVGDLARITDVDARALHAARTLVPGA